MDQKSKTLVINLVTNEEDFFLLLKKFIDNSLNLSQPTNKTPDEEELITVHAAAKFFQVSETTIHAWKNSGVIPYIKIKSRIRFKKSEILKLNEKRRLT